MKKNNRLFQNVKQWCLKVSVSSIIFISAMLFGGVIITLALPPSSLEAIKSTNANHQLTAENWDYLVDQVSGQVNKLTNLSGTLTTLSWRVNTNTTNITNLSGRVATLSGTIGILINNTTSSVRTKTGNNIYYTNGNVGIGTSAPTAKLQVAGNIIANDPTASGHVATKNYVDNHRPLRSWHQVQQIGKWSKSNVSTIDSSSNAFCFLQWISTFDSNNGSRGFSCQQTNTGGNKAFTAEISRGNDDSASLTCNFFCLHFNA